MRNKCLLFLVIVLCCTGCHVDYNLDIDNQLNLDESIVLQADTSSDEEKIQGYDEYLPVDYKADESAVFQKKFPNIEYYSIKKSKDNSSMSFQYKYNISQFNEGMFVKNCFKYITVMKKKKGKGRYGALLLSTSNRLLCMDNYDNLDLVTVNISSKYKLIESNADEVSHHKYTWYYDRGNYTNKHIYLLLDIKKKDLTIWEKFLEGEYFNTFTITLFIFMVVGIVIFILRRRGIERNKV